ncbi:membrane protease YdiL (CAAX protease family) [Natronocella acetinitrilica]|uniref:Membrane protease YdiL (CAAX protease family) n=2 Tax=Natronocella acetinitrilica TaxID=414046 RepID=A0AAE3G8H3_9GAMM|nr:membrane protease YdiL (CAAX protease family) [Natronocella acetinitrilica]
MSMRHLRFAGVRWRDRQLWLALALGPLAWAALVPVLPLTEQPLWPFAAPLTLLLAVVIYPVLEEIVFRGVIQDWLAERFSRKWWPLSLANIVTSALFAVFHLWSQPPLWALLVFFPSLVFGYFRERHDTLGTPILLHALYNLGLVWLFVGP